jgi:hypothetical protein
MIWRGQHKTIRPAAWLAVIAVLLQAILPALHHPAVVNVATLGGASEILGASQTHLCIAPGSTVPDAPAKGPVHHMPPCALCAAMHAVGAFVPPTSAHVAYEPTCDLIVLSPVAISLRSRWATFQLRARGPPQLA